MPSFRPLLQGVTTLLLTILVTSCSHPPGNGANGSYAKRMYIDANLSFAMALPEQWQRADEASRPSPQAANVEWFSTEKNRSGQPDVLARVISLPPAKAKGGFARIKADYLVERSTMKELSSLIRFVNRYPALQMIGESADRKLLVVFITSSRGAYTLEFVTHSAQFDDYLPVFEDILNSFRVL